MTRVLTPFQELLLRSIAPTEIGGAFYLTGGTALSAFYLHHRLSEDLDFFTSDPPAMSVVQGRLTEIGGALRAVVEYSRVYSTFIDCVVTASSGEMVRVDFAVDPAARLAPVERDPEYGILLDNSLDIASNKMSALFDRHEAKDFVDVFFIDRELYPFRDLLASARRKHIGMDNLWLAQSLRKVEAVSIIPRMLKPLRPEEMKEFFLGWAEKLIDELKE